MILDDDSNTLACFVDDVSIKGIYVYLSRKVRTLSRFAVLSRVSLAYSAQGTEVKLSPFRVLSCILSTVFELVCRKKLKSPLNLL